jgi:hypothetical protein
MLQILDQKTSLVKEETAKCCCVGVPRKKECFFGLYLAEMSDEKVIEWNCWLSEKYGGD